MIKKIVLQGGYGGHDSGDEAQLTTILIYLKKFIPDAEFLALSPDPHYTSKFHKVKSDYHVQHYLFSFSIKSSHIFSIFYRGVVILLRALKLLLNAWLSKKYKRTFLLNKEGQRILNNLKNASLLFNVGGGNLNSFLWGDLYGKGLTYLLCKILGKPVILSGQNIGPFNKWIDRKFACFVLNKVDVITTRDADISVRILEDMGVKSIVRETVDDGFLLPPIDQEEIKNVFSSEIMELHRPLIAMSVCCSLEDVLPPKDHTKVKNAIRTMAEIADLLISELGASVIFVPMDYNPRGPDDRVIASEVLKLIQYRDKAKLITNECDDRALKGFIGQMDLAIGFRYHFIVFATTMKVPAIGVYLGKYYEQKVRGFLRLMGQEKFAVDIEKLSSREIVKLAKNALLNRDKIIKELEQKTKVLGERALFTVKYAAKLLESK